MANGLYTAVSGATARERAVDATAHNIANASTPGFRPLRVTFEQTLDGAVKASAPMEPAGMGRVETTGRPLDVAIDGPGYLVSADGSLVRAGNLQVSPDGLLADASGRPVLGKNGPIEVGAAANVRIADDGVVYNGHEEADTLLVVDAAMNEIAPKLVTGAIEKPRYDAVEGMVDLIENTRAYEAMTRTIQTFSELDARTARTGGSS